MRRSSAPRSWFGWCDKPAYKLDPGVLGAPQTVAAGHPWPRSTLSRVLLYRTPRRRCHPGGRDGTVASTVLRSRRSQRDGGGLPAPCTRWQGPDRSSYLSDDHGGPSALVGVVGGK